MARFTLSCKRCVGLIRVDKVRHELDHPELPVIDVRWTLLRPVSRSDKRYVNDSCITCHAYNRILREG